MKRTVLMALTLSFAAACNKAEQAAPAPALPTVAPTPRPTAKPTIPPGKMSRAELAVEMVKAKYGETFDFPKEPFFTDVPASDPRFKYIQRFRADDLTKGCGGAATVFCGDDVVARYALASFLVRAKYGEAFTAPETLAFDDVPMSHANFRYMQRAVADGILKLCGERAFCPDALPSAEECRAAVKETLGKK